MDFCFGRWHVPVRLEQVTVVEPFNPFQGGELDGFQRTPRPTHADQLVLLEAVDALG